MKQICVIKTLGNVHNYVPVIGHTTIFYLPYYPVLDSEKNQHRVVQGERYVGLVGYSKVHQTGRSDQACILLD